jgi:predicted O-linked N-acetylglucosamine transferase (SPINDLY family)
LVTFGCLNNFAKANPDAQELWARILAATPGSRMLLSAPPGSHRDAFLHLVQTHGVAAERIEFFSRVDLEDYFRLYQRIDICLDSAPFAGGTTTFDALYMGVPVITLAGERAVGRGGVSILSNLGLSELIGHSAEEYVSIAKADVGGVVRSSSAATGGGFMKEPTRARSLLTKSCLVL